MIRGLAKPCAIFCAAAALSACETLPPLLGTEQDMAVSESETEWSPADYNAEFERNNYNDADTWLCHPDKPADACDADFDTLVVYEDVSTALIPFEASADPKIDCFYIYPTVSHDEALNADMSPGPEEEAVAAHQFGRFAKHCRLFAPVYRQFTRAALDPATPDGNDDMRRADIVDAWNAYLRNDNDGRGVVLIGHSQGAALLRDLLTHHIFGSPSRDLIVSAMPIGTAIHIDTATHSFGDMPVCETAAQTGCLISYASFRVDAPPPPESEAFGANDEDGRRAACVNPAALSGADGALDLRYTAFQAGLEAQNLVADYVAMPGLASAECVETDTHSYLAVTVHGDPNDPRTDDIWGDMTIDGAVVAEAGLHAADMALAMGDLVKIVGKQAAAWTSEDEAR